MHAILNLWHHIYPYLAIGLDALLFGAGGYLAWRRRDQHKENSRVSQLAGQLKNRQLQSEILIQSIADGVIMVDTTDKINIMNPAAAAMTGWPVNEAVGLDAAAVMKLSRENGQPLPSGQSPFGVALSEQKHNEQTVQLQARDGTNLIISLVVSPVVLPKTKQVIGAVAVFRDISTAKREEQQRAEFISTASHEMRTPVAAIEGYLALALNDHVSTIDSRARQYLEKAHMSTQHLGKLFQDLLTSAKAEDGRLSSHPVVIEVGSFVEQVTDDLRFTAEKKNLGLEFVLGTSDDQVIDASKGSSLSKVVSPLYYVHADPERLREVITNLFDNAVKFTERGKISIGLTGDNEVVQFHITDTGPGIPAGDIKHLFQKFYRVDSSATRSVGGTGLGLFICRKIIELYNGRIWVESQLGKGSTFYINLPRLDAQKASQLQATEQANAPLAALGASDGSGMIQ